MEKILEYKNKWLMQCISLLGIILWVCPLMAQEQAVPLVSWGATTNYVKTNLMTPRTSAGGVISFNLSTPISPGIEYIGGAFYGGIKATGTGGLSSGAQIADNNAYNGGGNDTFLFGRTATGAAIGDTVSGVFIWKQEDFPALSSGRLKVTSLSFNGRVNGSSSIAEARFVLRRGSGYMISADIGLPRSYSTTPVVLPDLSQVKWYSYDPVANMTSVGAPLASPSFDGVTEIGLFLTATNSSTSALNLAFSSFQASGIKAPSVFAFYPTYRQSGSLPVNRAPWSKITHLVHSFARVDSSLALAAPDNLLPNRTLVDTAHANGVKVLLALGGATNKTEFDAMANDLAKRNAFIKAVADWVTTYGYDGVVLDWEYPAAGNAQKVTNFLYNLRATLPKTAEIGMAVGWSASSATAIEADRRPTDNTTVTTGDIIDYLMVMSYDYHGNWNYAGHNAPLFSVTGARDDYSFGNTLTFWTSTKGFSTSKVIMGLPFYGHTFTGFSALGVPAADSTAITYNEVKSRITTGEWTLYRDETTGQTYSGVIESHRLPYMIKGSEMVSYDDELSIPPKVRWFRAKNLPGYLIWEIGQDYDGSTNVLLDAARAAW